MRVASLPAARETRSNTRTIARAYNLDIWESVQLVVYALTETCTLYRWTMRERGGRFESSCWTCLLFALGALQSCLAISTTAAHDALSQASNTPGESVNANADHAARELRRTIEESVLNRLASSIMEHGERVESGERRARPFVTLTYAQSIDGSISAADKSQVRERGGSCRLLLRACGSSIDHLRKCCGGLCYNKEGD